jgi:hypothetical protein
VWSVVTVMLLGAFNLGGWTCRFDMPGADPSWSLGNMLFLAGSVGLVYSRDSDLHFDRRVDVIHYSHGAALRLAPT